MFIRANKNSGNRILPLDGPTPPSITMGHKLIYLFLGEYGRREVGASSLSSSGLLSVSSMG
jgi:hypothetical protein